MVGPEQRRLRIKVVGGMLGGFLILVALVFGAFWPAAVLDVNGKALQSSVDILSEGSCDRLTGDAWRCRGEGVLYYSENVSYRVEVDDFGCWTAYEEGPSGRIGHSEHSSGCVRLANYLS